MMHTQIDETTLRELYEVPGTSLAKIAEKLDTPLTTLWRRCQDYGIDTNKRCIADTTPNEKLSYVLGVLQSDGSVCRWRVKLSVKDEVFAKSFFKALESIGLKPIMTRYIDAKWSAGGYYYVHACSSQFVDWHRSLTFEDIKEIVMKSEENMIAFLRGIYEGDGGLQRDTRWKTESIDVRIHISNRGILEFCSELCSHFGLESKIHVRPTGAMFLTILGTTPTKKALLELIGPCIRRA